MALDRFGSASGVSLYQAPDGENEALFIADTIERILVSGAPNRVAVLYRTNPRAARSKKRCGVTDGNTSGGRCSASITGRGEMTRSRT